jgi:predicted metal-dependent phosphoesterase TrpH
VRIDLHTHSYVSDGTQPPGDVVASAAQAGLDVVALTDHDTTAGWEEASTAAVRHGIALVRGIEISCARDGISVHLLGYLHDPTDAALLAELERSRSSRHTRAERIVRKLSADVPITYEEVLETAAPGATVGRPHIADALVAKGVVATRDDAFADYLYIGSPYHASHYAPDPVTAVRLVNAAGGVAVMAHPFAGRRGRLVHDEVIEAMADAGLAGLEAHHRDHRPEDVARAEEMARRLGLFVTGSSDYHGAGKVNVLGENTTAPAVLREIEERASGVPVLWP